MEITQPEIIQNAETNRIAARRQIPRAQILTEFTSSGPRPGRCGLTRRLAAIVYDGLLLIALWMIATALIVIPSGQEIRADSTLFQLYLLGVAWAYLAVCWRHGGQTLGMKAWRIRLTGNQQPITWLATVVRFIVALASLLSFGIGFLWSLFHPRRATWHDLASGTFLIVEPAKPSSRTNGPLSKQEHQQEQKKLTTETRRSQGNQP